MLHPKQNKYTQLLVVATLVCLGLALNLKHLNQFPKHIHAWAQSDRYALAVGFTQNGFDFFHPQTLVLNHQFPNAWQTADGQSITSVDFPLHEFLVGGLMKLTGNYSPIWFRAYIFLYSILGLYFLFLLTRTLTKSNTSAFFVVFFAATSPVFVYYQAGFLPTIPSFANACLGAYFYVQHRQHKSKRAYLLSLLFFTLAALSRTTFAIPLIALICTTFLNSYASRTLSLKKGLPFLLPIAAIGGYFLYNLHLRNTYGSIFLSNPLPPHSLSKALDIINTATTRWGTDYFSPLHYAVLMLIFGIALWRYKPKLSTLIGDHFALFTCFYTLGTLLFSGLMLLQFPDHDYYFLDTFFFPILCWLILALRRLPPVDNAVFKAMQLAIVLLLISPLYLYANKVQQQRYSTPEWSKLANTIDNFREAKALLARARVPDTASILLFDPQTPNASFILMGQEGYAMMLRNPKNIATALSWPFDYALLQKQYFVQDIYADYPAIGKRLRYVASGSNLSLVKKTTVQDSLYTALSLLGLNKKQTTWNYYTDSIQISATEEYGAPIYLTPTYARRQLSSYLLFEATVKNGENKDALLVCSGQKDQETVFFQTQPLAKLIKNKDGIEQIQTLFKIPYPGTPGLKLRFWIWNQKAIDLTLHEVQLSTF